MNIRAEISVTPEVERLSEQPYGIVVTRDPDGDWIGRILELPGHLAVGDTLDEMYTLAEDAKRSWIATALALGRPVPPPRALEIVPAKSGKFIVRIAPPIHALLAAEAELHGISLNELVTNTLSILVATGLDGLTEAVSLQESARNWEMVKARMPKEAARLRVVATVPREDNLIGYSPRPTDYEEGEQA
jgi:antitoxin HicB